MQQQCLHWQQQAGPRVAPPAPHSSRELLCGLPAVNPPLAVCSYITQAACNRPCSLPKQRKCTCACTIPARKSQPWVGMAPTQGGNGPFGFRTQMAELSVLLLLSSNRKNKGQQQITLSSIMRRTMKRSPGMPGDFKTGGTFHFLPM